MVRYSLMQLLSCLRYGVSRRRRRNRQEIQHYKSLETFDFYQGKIEFVKYTILMFCHPLTSSSGTCNEFILTHCIFHEIRVFSSAFALQAKQPRQDLFRLLSFSIGGHDRC